MRPPHINVEKTGHGRTLSAGKRLHPALISPRRLARHVRHSIIGSSTSPTLSQFPNHASAI